MYMFTSMNRILRVHVCINDITCTSRVHNISDYISVMILHGDTSSYIQLHPAR